MKIDKVSRVFVYIFIYTYHSIIFQIVTERGER